jgi:hypothetical protein
VRFITRFPVAGFILLVLFLSLAGGASAEPPSPTSGAHGCVALAESFLSGRLEIWQQRLNLADWKISMVVSHACDLKPKTLGNIHWDTNKKTACDSRAGCFRLPAFVPRRASRHGVDPGARAGPPGAFFLAAFAGQPARRRIGCQPHRGRTPAPRPPRSHSPGRNGRGRTGRRGRL